VRDTVNCEDCRFWWREFEDDGNDWGLCQINPPVVFFVGIETGEGPVGSQHEDTVSRFPATVSGDFCGRGVRK
jgi:hypothetical protein